MVSGIGSPTITPYAPNLERVDGPASKGTNAASTLVAANAHREASGDLTIKTREGDTVTLSAHLETDATFAAYRGRGAQASYLSLQSSSGFSISVEGDLSEQELKDVEKLVKQFGQELRQFFRGSDDASAADVGRGDFSSLAGFAANFESSASLTVVAGQAQAAPAEGTIASSPTSGSTFLGPAQPAMPTEEDAAPAVSTTPLAPDFTALQSLVGRLQRMVSTSSVGPEKALRVLGRVLDRLEDAIGGKDSRRHVLDGVRNQTGAPGRKDADGDSDGDAADSPARPAAVAA